jgi:UDP:flavonoid glycosyltransferase YjiC (YdhE family)
MGIYSNNLFKAGLSCREFNYDKVENIKAQFKMPLIFVSLGRSVDINYEVDVEELPYDFIYTDGIKLRGSNIHKLPIDTSNTHDYIKASEIVITKTGWSTVSESICARKPLLVLNRTEIREDVNTINNLLSFGIAKTIEFNQLSNANLEVYIEKTRKLKENYKGLSNSFQNKSNEIANRILELLH